MAEINTPQIITDSKTSKGLKQLYDLCEPVKGKGIYGHTVQLPEKFGIKLPEAYLWILSKDLKFYAEQRFTWNRSIKEIAKLEDVDGRNGVLIEGRIPKAFGGGMVCRNGKWVAASPEYNFSLYDSFSALASGDRDVKPGWVMPPLEMVVGEDVPNNLYALRHKMPKGSKFETEGCDTVYQVGTEYDMLNAYSVNFGNGEICWDTKNCGRDSVRPVCLEFRL